MVKHTFKIEQHNPSKIIIAGDWHRNMHATFANRVVKLAKAIGIDTILHVGDFGYKFGIRGDDAYLFEKPLHQSLLKNDVKLFWIDGNHENHEYLRNLPELDSGFKQTGARGNIFYIPRGHRWEWHGRKFGALGGAWSPSWQNLKEGVTLYSDLEQPTIKDVEKLGSESLDYLITHDVPSAIDMRKYSFAILEENKTRDLIQQAVENTLPNRIFSGHWHTRLNLKVPNHANKDINCHILDREWSFLNILLLDLENDTINPLPELWSQIHYQEGE